MAGENVQRYFSRDQVTGDYFCSFCNQKYAKGTTSTRLRGHLTGEAKTGARICSNVPPHVKESLSIESSNKRQKTKASGCIASSSSSQQPKRHFEELQLPSQHQLEPSIEEWIAELMQLGLEEQINKDAPLMEKSSATIREARRYHVFLSFRGKDTRNGFTSHLHEALSRSQISTFIDNNLRRGDNISPSLLTTIEESMISVIIFSENYANSRWCLKELVKILQCRELNGQIVIPVFYGVDPSHVRKQVGKFGVAFNKLKEHLREGEMDLNEVRYHLEESGNISGWNSHDIRPESELIRSIVGDILKKVEVLEGIQETGESASLTKCPVGDAFGRNVEKIWSWLMDDQVLRVGIYGMGGVGKTTLMRHIQTLLEGQSSLKVFWVTVSQDFSIWKLQDLIAKKIDLKFLDKEEEAERAKKLTQTLKAKGKCVLILDDSWNNVELDKVGIPVGVNQCKLVLTTRLLKVCRQMDCSERNTIQVQRLSEEEAWILFTQELGNYRTEVEELAKAVSKECAGLPLGIRVMARSMKGICNVHTWRNTLEELKESKVSKGHEMREEVFSVLKFSYLRLNDPALQECLSYCALFPEDYKIDRGELIEYMIVEGIIDERKSRQAELDKGHTMLDTLENACLLEGDTETVWPMEDDTKTVWMHDLIRDMLILELREGSKTLVEAGAQLKELPEVEKWTENLVRVSLISNGIEVIPSGHTPRCPNLSTLLLCRNHGLKMIADSFFEQFQKLKILDLTWCYEIEELPRSISDLVNLTALLLRDCWSLIHVPSLAKLEKLKKLDLNRCKRLEEMPEGVKFLLDLKYLDLSGSGIEEIGSGIIPMLSRLQVLKLCDEFEVSKLSIRGSEVGELRMLETLHCRFSNVREFGEYMKSREWSQQSPSDYSIFIERKRKILDWPKTKLGSRKFVSVTGDNFIDSLALPTDIEALNINYCYSTLYKRLFPPSLLASLLNLQEIRVANWGAIEEIFAINEGENGEWVFPFSNYSTRSLSNHSFLNLKLIDICACHQLKKLFPPSLLPNLQKISVQFCYGMEEIFSTDQEEEDGQELLFDQPNLTGLHLSRLTTLELVFLPELRSIYKGAIICHSLQQIQLVHCPKLKRITLPLPQPSLQRIQVDGKEWWESVQWGEANDKMHLQTFVSLNTIDGKLFERMRG